MNFRRKLAVLALGIGLLMPLSAAPVFAVDLFNNPKDSGAVCSKDSPAANSAVCASTKTPSGQNPIFGKDGVLGRGLSIFGVVIGIISVIVIIISGLRLVVSGGDSNTISASRRAIIYSLIGLAIAALSQAIVSYLLSRL